MTTAMKALVAMAKESIAADVCEDFDATDSWCKAFVEAIAAVEREEAVEHAIARKVLEKMIEWCETKRSDAIPVRDVAQKDGEREAEIKWAAIVRTYEIVLSELPRHLSLLSARNFEVVEIPQGEMCGECQFNDDEEDEACGNWKAPLTGKDAFRQKAGERSVWCRSRYGVEERS